MDPTWQLGNIQGVPKHKITESQTTAKNQVNNLKIK